MFWPGSQQFWRPLPGCCAPFPSAASGPGSQSLGALSTGAPRLFPPWPQRAPLVGSHEVFRQEPGPVCSVGGGGFSGADFGLFPSPLPPTSSGDGAAPLRVSQSLVLRPVNFPSLSHSLKKSSSDCSQGPLAGPHPKQCRWLLSVPPLLLVAGVGYFSAGSCL